MRKKESSRYLLDDEDETGRNIEIAKLFSVSKSNHLNINIFNLNNISTPPTRRASLLRPLIFTLKMLAIDRCKGSR